MAAGLMGGAGIGALTKMSSESKRDEREPFVMISVDRLFNYGAVAIPGAALAVSLYFGKELFTSSGIQIVNPINEDTGASRFNRWTETDLVKEYCWAHLSNYDTVDQSKGRYLFEFSYYPYILFLLVAFAYLLQTQWRLKDLNSLVSTLAYIIEGIEEQVNDLLAILVDNTDKEISKENNNKKQSGVDNSGDSNQIENEKKSETTNIVDIEKIELLKNNQIDDSLYEQIREVFCSPKYSRKYEKFHRILAHLSKSTHFYKKFVFRRVYFIFYHIISVTVLYVLYLNSNGKLEKINCPLPRELYYQQNGNQIKYVIAYYTPYNVRIVLVSVTVLAQIILSVTAAVTWCRHSLNVNTRGIRLLENLPTHPIEEYKLTRYNDLSLIMDLVIENKARLAELRFALNVHYSVEVTTELVQKKTDVQNRRLTFIRAMQEMVLWTLHGNNAKVKKIIQNDAIQETE
jgi:hypothetical protein